MLRRGHASSGSGPTSPTSSAHSFMQLHSHSCTAELCAILQRSVRTVGRCSVHSGQCGGIQLRARQVIVKSKVKSSRDSAGQLSGRVKSAVTSGQARSGQLKSGTCSPCTVAESSPSARPASCSSRHAPRRRIKWTKLASSSCSLASSSYPGKRWSW